MKNQMFRKTNQSFRTVKNAFSQFAFVTLLTLFMFNGLMSAESADTQFVPFSTFMDQTLQVAAASPIQLHCKLIGE